MYSYHMWLLFLICLLLPGFLYGWEWFARAYGQIELFGDATSFCTMVFQITGCSGVFAQCLGDSYEQQVYRRTSNVCFYFFFGDGPRLCIQIYNTLLVGQTLTWVQIMSPALKAIFVFMRSCGYAVVSPERR